MPSIVILTDFLGVPTQIEDIHPISFGNQWRPMFPVRVFRSPGVGAVMFALHTSLVSMLTGLAATELVPL